MCSPLQENFINLIKNQRLNIPIIGNYGKLTFEDIKRFSI